MYEVYIKTERPDFRVFIGLIYSDKHDVDTEGNANPVNSRDWTELYIKDRQSNDPPIEIWENLVYDEKKDVYVPVHKNQLVLVVKSALSNFEEIVAIYLFLFSGDEIYFNGKKLQPSEIEYLKEKHQVALQKANSSKWHCSSNFNPYP